uniref:HTH La-type RNA-binding domain-containing protein n=1 Tax=Kalanchoe fedtschenkoi TaxID=63787 RepID=A0A7N0UUR7_KALFE
MKLTDNIAFIMEAIRASTVVEVKDDKVRRRNDWMKWLMPESLEVPSQSTYLDPGKSGDFAARIQKINIDGWSSDIPSTTPQSGDPPLQTPSHTDHAAENRCGKYTRTFNYHCTQFLKFYCVLR